LPEELPEPNEGTKRRSKLPLILGLVGCLVLGAGGFAAAFTGLLPIGGGGTDSHAAPGVDSGDGTAHGEPAAGDHGGQALDATFVPIEPLIINLGEGGSNRHLRFRAELEVESGFGSEVAALMPRVVDVMNGYLRAVSVADLEEPAALVRLRAQLLRRIQVATGEGRVRDLLVMEFVLN